MRTLREPRTILLGLTGVTLYYSFANIGLLFTTPGHRRAGRSLLPVLTAIAAVALIHERLTGRTSLGLALATVGVALVAASGFRLDFVGAAERRRARVVRDLHGAAAPDAGRGDAPDALVLATATGVWGTVLMLPWLGVGARHRIGGDPRPIRAGC